MFIAIYMMKNNIQVKYHSKKTPKLRYILVLKMRGTKHFKGKCFVPFNLSWIHLQIIYNYFRNKVFLNY